MTLPADLGRPTGPFAASAGLPAPSFHRHFDDLEAAALAAYGRALAWLRAVLVPLLGPADLAWPIRVRAVVGGALGLLANHPDLTHLRASEFPRSGAAAPSRHQAVVDQLAAVLRVGRAECAWGAQLPADSERIAIGGVLWMPGHRARRGEGGRLPALAPEVVYLLLVPCLDIADADRVILDQRPSPAASALGR
jgi:AcrR family transcriptional regulator